MISKLILKGTEAAFTALTSLYYSTAQQFTKTLIKDYSGVWSEDRDYVTMFPNYTDVKVQQWCATDTYETYKKTDNKRYGTDNITYRIYRDFRAPQSQRVAAKHIACFGCSNTFGVGLPYEKTWPFLLNDKLGTDYMCHNFGVNGGSADTICRLVYTLLLREKPHAVICHFPDIFRVEYYNINDENITHFGPWISSKYEAEYKAYNLLTNEYVAFFNFVKNFKFIEMVCKLHNIPFIWHTWSRGILTLDSQSIKVSHIGIAEKYLNTNCIMRNNIMYDIVEHTPEAGIDKARDNMHFGKTYNDILSTEFAKLLSAYN
jgi:hypothetical protein